MTVQSTDQTEAADEINYLIDSKAGLASATTQKALTDDTTGQVAEAGDPVDLALTDAEQAQLISASDAALTAILAARTAVPAADAGADTGTGIGTDPSADTSADSSADAGADTASAPAQS
jgi:hypothetical protein